MNNMNSSLLQISKQPRRQYSLWEEALSIYQRDYIVLLRDHPEGRHRIQLFMVVLKYMDPNVYTIHPVCGGLVHMVNHDNYLTLRNHPLGIVGILIPMPRIHPPQTNLPFSS